MAPESCLDTDGCVLGAFCIFPHNLTQSMAPDMCHVEGCVLGAFCTSHMS